MTIETHSNALITEHKRLCEICSEIWSAKIGLLSLSTMDILYISDRLVQDTGICNQMATASSKAIFSRILHPKELPSITQAHFQTIRYFNKLYLRKNTAPYADAKYYFRMKMADGSYKSHMAFIHPVSYSEVGLPLISFVLLTPESKLGAEKFSIATTSCHSRLYFSASANKYVPKENLKLKSIECRILELTAKGYGETKIAKILEIKLDLLRYYKKSIYKKYHVSNITEAVYTAIHTKDL